MTQMAVAWNAGIVQWMSSSDAEAGQLIARRMVADLGLEEKTRWI